MIRLENFSFSYQQNEIFRDVNLQISLERPVLIRGVNGSGKTTLARILCGLQKDFTGNILLDNQAISKFSKTEFASKMLYIKQETEQNFVAATLQEDLQVWQQGFSKEHNEQAKRMRFRIFQNLNLDKIANSLIWKLSGGQRKRGSLAPLWLSNKKIWLLDEPTAGLDVDSIEILLNKITRGKNRVIIFSNRNAVFEELMPLELHLLDKKIIRIS
jgi:energy-coupling factor transporter ATP-binding protein EcfA2